MSLDKYEGNIKDYANGIRNKLDGGFVFVINQNEDKLSMVASAGNKATEAGINCGKLISAICAQANGKGGGRPDLAQGGGSNADPQTLLKEVENMIL